MSEIIVNAEPVDPKEDEARKVANEIRAAIHIAADAAEQAIMASKPEVKESLKNAARALLEAALTKLDESVGASVADKTNDEED